MANTDIGPLDTIVGREDGFYKYIATKTPAQTHIFIGPYAGSHAIVGHSIPADLDIQEMYGGILEWKNPESTIDFYIGSMFGPNDPVEDAEAITKLRAAIEQAMQALPHIKFTTPLTQSPNEQEGIGRSRTREWWDRGLF